MATRYVWSKYNKKVSNSLSKTTVTSVTAKIAHGYLFASNYVHNGTSFTASGSLVQTGNGGEWISEYPYLFISEASIGERTFTQMYVENAKTDYAVWREVDSGGMGLWEKETAVSVAYLGSFYKATPTTSVSKGSTNYGYIASSSSSKYPSNSYSGSYWYVYAGSDCIDPTALTCAEPKAGRVVTVTATARSNTYGGNISYLYQYSVDGGSTWTTIETTTATSTTVTVPNGAEQFQARVRASDDMGFTSTTYVYSDNVDVSGGGIGYCGVEGATREGAFHACVDGVIKTDFTVCACVDGVIKECS